MSRLRLYDYGNTRCPICLTPFTRDAAEAGQVVTLEHVPPKTLGGSVRCLTCADCNKMSGRSLDQAAAMRNNSIKDLESGRGNKIEIDIFGTKHTTYIRPDGFTKEGLPRRLANNQDAMSLFNQLSDQKILLLTEIKRGPVWDISKGITLTEKQPPSNHLTVSWLRSAYLLVFSLLGKSGYRYAESEAIQPIREQIMKPDNEFVPSLLFDLSSLQAPKELILLNKGQQPFCWIVKIEQHGCVIAAWWCGKTLQGSSRYA